MYQAGFSIKKDTILREKKFSTTQYVWKICNFS